MSSGFVTESEIAESRRKRQEEWERVRNADQPLEVPEEPYDSRTLYDRLQEQKQKKDLEYEEAHKLKNMIKGLDDDEIEFLDLVDRTKLAVERKKTLDEERELNDYRNRVASLQEKSMDQRLHAEVTITTKSKAAMGTTRQSQLKLLKGVVVKKSEPKKRKLSETDFENSDKNTEDSLAKKPAETNERTDSKDKENCHQPTEAIQASGKRKLEKEIETVVTNSNHMQGALTCIGILPGMGCYDDSSESDVSSDSEAEHGSCKIDILGRKIKKLEKAE